MAGWTREIQAGPSPRVRGSPRHAARSTSSRGSIPACAGKPRCQRCRGSASAVHPRVCGEACSSVSADGQSRGPSPRVRGSHVQERPRTQAPGSIPACAGKPVRVVGIADADGLPVGSIPACAGKPSTATRTERRSRVHPRVCGEAIRRGTQSACGAGPSPRVRGSHAAPRVIRVGLGSIPACAGKPSAGGPNRPGARVHPRVCGEAGVRRTVGERRRGPSPRVRGSPVVQALRLAAVGSIPACAGKPARPNVPRDSGAVHPRVCGEAFCSAVRGARRSGPSPRVRGSQCCQVGRARRCGSIPACAGKPC